MKTPPRRILVIGLRRLGDLLLATALIRSLKAQWPSARLDVLIPAGGEEVFAGNPDINGIIGFTRGQGALKLAAHLFRRYDLSVSLQLDDRAQILGFLAAPHRVSVVPIQGKSGWRWKRWINQAYVQEELHFSHVVRQYLRLAETLRVEPVARLAPPQPHDIASVRQQLEGRGLVAKNYAVVHPFPMYAYKAWTDAGWRTLIAHLRTRGLRVAVTGGPDPGERQRVTNLLADFEHDAEVVNLCGALALPELSVLLRGANLFVGPDTAITHLAAACGTQTLALFGPSNPVAWGPWPMAFAGAEKSPWQHTAALQQRENVWLLQGTHGRFGACIPCMQEGCERRRESLSDCLTKLEPARVVGLVDQIIDAGNPPVRDTLPQT